MKHTSAYVLALLLCSAPLHVSANAAARAAAVAGTAQSADEDTRKDPELALYMQSVGVRAGEQRDIDLYNPHNLTPIYYESSDESVCQVDAGGVIYAANVKQTTVVSVTISFAGNEEYRPQTLTLEVGIVPQEHGQLKAAFTTDHSVVVDYDQEFDSADEMADWTMDGDGWHLDNLKFGDVKPSDQNSLSISYAAGEGQSILYSPKLEIKEGAAVEFYAYFKTKNLRWAPWTLDVVDCATGVTTRLINIYLWAFRNNYRQDDTMRWKKLSADVSAFAGRTVQFVFTYPFDGESLALDAFRLVRDNPQAETSITVPADEPILFTSTSDGDPESTAWQFPGAATVITDGNDATVTYSAAGTYDVTLAVSRDGESSTCSKTAFVTIEGRAPHALIAMPDDAYESPNVGAFVPTGVPVSFADASDGNPTAWSWQFAGPAVLSATEQNPSITFTAQGTYSASMKAQNAYGSATCTLDNCIQAGGEQLVWNVGSDEAGHLAPIVYDNAFGYYAGSNRYGLERVAEKYKAPLADAVLKSVSVCFAAAKSTDPDAEIPLAIYSASAADGSPADVLGETSLRASQLQAGADEPVPTVFTFDNPVKLEKGKPFFVAIGPFPSTVGYDSSVGYATLLDAVAVYCVSRSGDGKCTTWDLPQGGTRWIENRDGHNSLAAAPLLSYGPATAIALPSAHGAADGKPAAVYNLGGQQVSAPQRGSVYIVRRADGTSRKVVWK